MPINHFLSYISFAILNIVSVVVFFSDKSRLEPWERVVDYGSSVLLIVLSYWLFFDYCGG